MIRYVTLLAAAVTLTGGTALFAQSGSAERMTNGNLSSADRTFMMKAAQVTMAASLAHNGFQRVNSAERISSILPISPTGSSFPIVTR